MADVTKAIRHKRFEVLPDKNLSVILETSTGNRWTFKIVNCSLNGIGTKTEGDIKDEGLEPGFIVPTAKLSIDGTDYGLGRLVVRTALKNGAYTHFGFSTIDNKLPVDGPMSKFLKLDFDKTHSAYDVELNPEKFNLAHFAENQNLNADLFAKTKQFSVFFKDWEKSHKYSYHNVRVKSKGTRINLNRTRPNGRTDFIIMGSNDYLGLATHPKVVEAAKNAMEEYGFGSTGSALTTGITQLHEDLCDTLAQIFKKDKALLFNSGYNANIGAITGLVGAQDLVVADVLSHASIQDAMGMARGTARFYKHNNVEHLEKLLDENRSNYSGAMVITEGIFSMDGDVPPLDKINKVAKKYNARLFVDEAHSFGVIGRSALGAADKFNLIKETDILMGTFSKICGGIGGFIVSNEDVVDWLKFFGRSHMFSVTIPPSTAAAAIAALRVFKEQPELVSNLKKNIAHFTSGLQHLGYPIDSNSESAVIPFVVGDEKKIEVMNKILLDGGVFVVPIVYPAVGRSQSRFRFTVMATHTIADLDYVLNVLADAIKTAGLTFEHLTESLRKTG